MKQVFLSTFLLANIVFAADSFSNPNNLSAETMGTERDNSVTSCVGGQCKVSMNSFSSSDEEVRIICRAGRRNAPIPVKNCFPENSRNEEMREHCRARRCNATIPDAEHEKDT